MIQQPASNLLLSQLTEADRAAMLDHLLRLDTDDRTQRFSYRASDEVVQAYIARLDFVRDAHFGIWAPADAGGGLVALTHLAFDAGQQPAEVGVSVDAAWRRNGLATRLLRRAILHARNRGVTDVVMYFLPYNTELSELARHLGMSLSLGEGSGIARLQGTPPDFASVGEELFESWAALTSKQFANWSAGAVDTSQTLRRGIASAAGDFGD